MSQPYPEPRRFFLDRYGLAESELEHVLGTAVGTRADHADLYFEFREVEMLQMEESLVKKANRTVSQGVGVRVVARDRTGFAYSNEVSPETLRVAARTARTISNDSSASSRSVPVGPAHRHDLYPVANPPIRAAVSEKLRLLERLDAEARALDPRIRNVIASLVTEQRVVLVVTPGGVMTGDVRPLVRLNVSCIASEGSNHQTGISGGGGRVSFETLLDPLPGGDTSRGVHFAREAARQAVLNLEAVDAPAGPQTVVLGPGWPGILLHEAVGHGLEADFNRKGVSAFSGRTGERVASELCTVVDDGTLEGRRGSLNVDDEGTPTSRTVLIENGVLRGYLQDRMNASLLGSSPTGNGRRESFAHPPMPRMTNTFLLAGEDAPEDVLRSVSNGLYAVSFGGGQVDITSGRFVFSASEAYLIENGRVTRPVRGATLIGSGPEILHRVSRVGSDLELDTGIGTCGKEGQSVPVGVGLPTIRIDDLVVGGTRVG